jgi:DNA-binding NtrC family response regulator
VPVNVRVVAASRRDLLEDINQGGFRDDLYFRIAQARVSVPPLRDRTDDLGPLVRRMMELAGQPTAFKRVTSESLDRLQRHDWPGNVRELRNLVSVAMAYDKGGPIDLAAHLNERGPRPRRTSSSRGAHPDRPYPDSKHEHDRVYFTALYDATDGNLSEIARRAKVNRETVRIYLRMHRIGSYARSGK